MDLQSSEMSQSHKQAQLDVEDRIQGLKNTLALKKFFRFNFRNDENQELNQLAIPQLNKLNTESSQSSINSQQVQRVFADTNILLERKLIDITKIYDIINTGFVFEVIVLRKDEKQRALIVSLNKFHSICDQCNLQQMSEQDFQNYREKQQQLIELQYVYLYKIQAIIKESDLIDYFSIFSNDFNYDKINEGDELYAVITKNWLSNVSQQEQLSTLNSDQRYQLLELSCKNEVLQNSKFLSIQNILDPRTYDPSDDLFIRLGSKPDNNIKATQDDMLYLEKYSVFPYDLQIRRSTTLKNIEIKFLIYHPSQNEKRVVNIFININRIRELQNIRWAKQSLDEATRLIKENKHPQALQYLSTAQDFDPYMPQIYVTRGCALANLGKYKEGIIELKKGLQLDPDDEITKKYLERVLKKYEEEQRFLYTKQAKQLSFDKQKLEMKNNAALNFNGQDNTYKFVAETELENKEQSSLFQNQNELTFLTSQNSSELTNKLTSSQMVQLMAFNSKKLQEQNHKKEGKSHQDQRSSSSSSSDRKKKKKKDKKIKKEKKEKKDKKKKSKS
ncbi:tetratricopeptide repeat protein (macronuclear) [Tetrahymena thermophila SB210]|uniref:Tetratricopeptide repeat protein n=1 Tax=Tetrahymena thermophila (strain SB210) TaxID=312017 RepID=I7MLB7_TETTS|nr:tetratricopeptide repeat protein [Tetrahymena thermophila SB210]EAS01626.3 tetratricopeptide repeat protein [Tetrahymena thermophila SB210]|eukprot:XP_001021871.3 tetratricopeptide repeat protein [Tetrahymena thermophila SB210]